MYPHAHSLAVIVNRTRLTFGVAGGGVRGHSIPAIPRSVARQLRDELLDISA